MPKTYVLDDYTRVPWKECIERGPGFYYSFLEAQLACSLDISCTGVTGYMTFYTCIGGVKETPEMIDAVSSTYEKAERFSECLILIQTWAKKYTLCNSNN